MILDTHPLFQFLGKTSFYAIRIDGEGRLLHAGHGPILATSSDSASSAPMTGGYFVREWAGNSLELPGFGDLSNDEVALKISFAKGGEPPVRDLRLRYAGHSLAGDARSGSDPDHGLPTRVRSPRQTLKVELFDALFDFRVTVCYRFTPEHDIIERWLEMKNFGSSVATVEQCFWGALPAGHGTWELTHLDGFWATETHINREILRFGTKSIESRTIHTGALHNPAFFLNRTNRAGFDFGEVWFGALAFSGNWKMSFHARHDLFLRAFAGYNPYDCEFSLSPGASHSTPAFLFGLSVDGWNGASRRLHGFQRDRILPFVGDRPVVYNSWEATSFGVTETNQKNLAAIAASLGVEVFVLDDGWFSSRRNAEAGLGDWWVSKDAFPDGLAPLVEEVERLGMKFGIWIEPEMVNPDSELYRAHPEWVLHYPGRPRTEMRGQLILDFGRQEVVDYLYGTISELLRTHRIYYIKWDMNRTASEAGSVVGKEIWFRHCEGVYRLLDQLRREFPLVSFQGCSAGGSRVDAGMMARVDEFWTSDNTDALCRVAIQEGFNYAYAPRAMSCWVTDERNDQTGRVSSLALRFDVAMRGALGIGTNLLHLSEKEKEEYRERVAFYKTIRHLVQNGDCYRLAELAEHQASVWQFVAGDASEAVVSFVVASHRTAQVLPACPLKGLDAGAVYTAKDYRGETFFQATGRELMTLGVGVRFPQDGPILIDIGFSRTLHLTRSSG